ncbi:sensor histidine kinase [Cellulomonas aerilata]|nr:histidine kinase [Cellulomonas aerilata]
MTVQSDHTQPAAATAPVPWRTLADGRGRLERRPAPTLRRGIAMFCLASAIALVSILVLGAVVIRSAAEKEALRDARVAAGILARTVVEPALQDGLLTGDPAAIDAMDEMVETSGLMSGDLVRIKLWTADGRIVYSDEPRLIGQVFGLDEDEADTLAGGPPAAELSDLSGPENAYERELAPRDGLLEVYRHVTLPSGENLLFETYSSYSRVTERRGEVLWEFAPVTVGAVVLLQLCQLPLVWTLVKRLRVSQRASERLLRRAIDASTAERRRIAGNVHDSVVQGLAGASFVIAGAVDQVERGGQPKVADELREAARGIRQSIRGLRATLVEIYPPSVSVAGLPAALADLVAPLRAQGLDADAVAPSAVELPRAVEALVFRVAQEALRNVAQHSGARSARLTLTVVPGLVRLEVADDGAGLDVDEALRRGDGHVGMKVLCDLAEEAGALLQIASTPGAGTTVRLEVEVP